MMLLCNRLSTMVPLYGVIRSSLALALFNIEHHDTTYLGLGKYARNARVLGEMGWQLLAHRMWSVVTRQWCRLLAGMPRTRLNAHVFVWARQKALGGNKSHCKKMIDFYKSVNVWHLLQPPLVFNVNKMMTDIDQAVKGLLESKWRVDINSEINHTGGGRNKLRTYRLFKHSFGTSPYLKDTHLTHAQRSAMAEMRCGIAPIYALKLVNTKDSEEERICPLSDMDEIESEIHVMILCPLYNDIRATLYE